MVLLKMIHQQTNEQIVSIIIEYIEEHPEKKFMEILYNLGVIPITSKITDLYCETPDETIQRMNKTIIKYKN